MRCAMIGVLMLLMANVAAGDEVQDLRAELAATKAELKSLVAVRDQLLSEVVTLSDTVTKLQDQMAQHQQWKLKVRSDAARWFNDSNATIDAGRTTGEVLSAADGIFGFNLGSDDGVKVGMEACILREDRLVGLVKIQEVTANRSFAEVTREFWTPIRKGDQVAFPTKDENDATKPARELGENRRETK